MERTINVPFRLSKADARSATGNTTGAVAGTERAKTEAICNVSRDVTPNRRTNATHKRRAFILSETAD